MRIAVLDLETDPFAYGEMVYPFLSGFHDGDRTVTFWGDDTVERMVKFLHSEQEPWTIYAHNGGRFDWFYFLEHIKHDALKIVNGRIIQARLGIHELRDSYAILPFALEQYAKTKIEYKNFRREVREQHREEIEAYLRDDLRDLFTLVSAFVSEFGNKLTVGSTAMGELKKLHKFTSVGKEFDAQFRDKFYYGGRCQTFRTGILNEPVKVFDVNSMYPDVMKRFLHPVSAGIYRGTKIKPDTCFVTVTGRNYGAFPMRMKNGSLDFTVEHGTFHTTIHEFEAAEETGTFRCEKLHTTLGFSERISFGEFVDKFYNARLEAKKKGDKVHELLYKFVLNSGYGKFAQDPENYCDWFLTPIDTYPPEWHECKDSCESPCRKRWTPSFEHTKYTIWERPLGALFYFNIATGASITGAARAQLLRGLKLASNPIYCDTDSIICTDLRNVSVDGKALGSWKLEATGTDAAMCGKKLYAIFDKTRTGETIRDDEGNERPRAPRCTGACINKAEKCDCRLVCIKKANKGARLTGAEILSIGKGGSVESFNPVPAFKWDGTYKFTRREIKRTGKALSKTK